MNKCLFNEKMNRNLGYVGFFYVGVWDCIKGVKNIMLFSEPKTSLSMDV